jgi:Zn finger protein HypA/HybF involved in hydrogenase expression
MSDLDNPPFPDVVIPFVAVLQRARKPTVCDHQRFEVDETNKLVTCLDCGQEVSAFDAMVAIAQRESRYLRNVQALYDARKALENWRPHLVPVRELERMWRGGVQQPGCPHCRKALSPDDLLKGQVWEPRRRGKDGA